MLTLYLKIVTHKYVWLYQILKDFSQEMAYKQRIHACSTIDLVGMSYVNNVDECKSLCKSHKCCGGDGGGVSR